MIKVEKSREDVEQVLKRSGDCKGGAEALPPVCRHARRWVRANVFLQQLGGHEDARQGHLVGGVVQAEVQVKRVIQQRPRTLLQLRRAFQERRHLHQQLVRAWRDQVEGQVHQQVHFVAKHLVRQTPALTGLLAARRLLAPPQRPQVLQRPHHIPQLLGCLFHLARQEHTRCCQTLSFIAYCC